MPQWGAEPAPKYGAVTRLAAVSKCGLPRHGYEIKFCKLRRRLSGNRIASVLAGKDRIHNGQDDAVKLEERGVELSRDGIAEISAALRGLLADVFTLYLKTKNFHGT